LQDTFLIYGRCENNSKALARLRNENIEIGPIETIKHLVAAKEYTSRNKEINRNELVDRRPCEIDNSEQKWQLNH
jgi:FlaA1/EpsC-like NDP-sugar epimerase